MSVYKILKASATVAAVRAATPTGPQNLDALPLCHRRPKFGVAMLGG